MPELKTRVEESSGEKVVEIYESELNLFKFDKMEYDHLLKFYESTMSDSSDVCNGEGKSIFVWDAGFLYSRNVPGKAIMKGNSDIYIKRYGESRLTSVPVVRVDLGPEFKDYRTVFVAVGIATEEPFPLESIKKQIKDGNIKYWRVK